MQSEQIDMHFVRAELHTIKDDNAVALVLENAGLTMALLNSNTSVSTQQYFAVCQGVSTLLGDEMAGRGLGKLPVGYFATLCKYAIHGDTLLKCLARIVKFSNLFEHISGVHFDLTVDAEKTRYIATSLYSRADDFFLIERTFLNVFKYLTWVAGRHIQLSSASFRTSPPSYMESYRQLFYCDLVFNQSEDHLVFQTADLLHTPAHHEKDLAVVLDGTPQCFWVRPSIMRSYAAMVRRVLFDSVEGDAMDFDTVAAKLEISTVTLRRRLKKEFISFQEIKDHIRRDKAIALMHDMSKTISDIAFELGYSDPSAFYRAFRNWVGATPNQYRAAVTR